MPVPTGTATPWQMIEGPLSDEGGPLVVQYYKIGNSPGSSDLLAEQLRIDGFMTSLGPALAAARAAELERSWVGTLDSGEEVLCTRDRWTASGDLVEEAFPCIVAFVNTEEN